MMVNPPEYLKKYIESCWECRHECQGTLFNHCLQMGGDHLKPDHVKIMMDCIQICQVAADAMVRQSTVIADICMACANACESCADSCEALGDEEMEYCAKLCRSCADYCRKLVIIQDMERYIKSDGEGRITA